MSGFHRLLSRREKNTSVEKKDAVQKKVKSPPALVRLPLLLPSFVSTYTPPNSSFARPPRYQHLPSSIFSLSLAFPHVKIKRSAHLQSTVSIIQSSTANCSDHLLLQPRQTGGTLQGLLGHEVKTPMKEEDDKKVNPKNLQRDSMTLCWLDQKPETPTGQCWYHNIQRR